MGATTAKAENKSELRESGIDRIVMSRGDKSVTLTPEELQGEKGRTAMKAIITGEVGLTVDEINKQIRDAGGDITVPKHGERAPTDHERDLARLVEALSSPQFAGDPELKLLVEHRLRAIGTASERLRPLTRQHVIEGLRKHRLKEMSKNFEKRLDHVVTGEELGRRGSAVSALRTMMRMMLVVVDLVGHSAILDPDREVTPGQGDLVEEARAAEAEAVANGEQGDIVEEAEGDEPKPNRIKPAAQVARPQAFPGGKGAPAPTDLDPEENARRAATEVELAEPIYSDEAKTIARKTWDKKRDEAFDFYEVEKWEHLPEVSRRAIVTEIVERFGNVDQKAAWARLLASRDGAAAGEVE